MEMHHGLQDDLYENAVEATQLHGTVSISHLQRVLHIGYNRAAWLVEAMELKGVVSAPAYNGHRTLLITKSEVLGSENG